METVFLEIEKTEARLSDFAGTAAYLGISRSAVRKLVDSRRLSRVLLPSFSQCQSSMDRLLLDRADLDAVIERGKTRPNA
jgi:hypothetical protein